MSFTSSRESLVQLERELTAAWESCGRSSPKWVAASCPAPLGAATSLVDLEASPHRVYWAGGTDDGPELLVPECFGIGVAQLVQLNGEDRFERARVLIEETYNQIHCREDLRSQIRFFGGTSFSPERAPAEPSWKEFGDAHFLLPRVLYQADGDGARLICLAERTSLQESLDLARMVLEAAEAAPSPDSAILDTIERHDSAPPTAWHSLIVAIQSSIKDGNLEKVVAARCVKIQVSQSPRLSTVMGRLAQIAPRCARFALTVGQQTFVGATPERLVQRLGNAVRTEALAGSIDARAEDATRVLLESQKDRHEHAYVVQAIEQTLEPLCSELQLPQMPDVRALKHILHLRTPIRGTLKTPVHVLSLVDRLHPTPAVGGLPQGKAVSWILEHEQAERGWYAAPIGWLDAKGDGEFYVALRSALISGRNIHIYAGAGIVAESDPEAEYAETELKLSGMLSALGLAC